MNSPYKGRFKVTQEFKGSAHDGLDIVGLGDKTIYSTVDGTVERAGWENSANHKQGFGQYVRIKQKNSADRYYYGHLSKINVKVGQAVKVGDIIGIEGNTGYSFGSHCHYCVRGNASKSEIRDINTISGIPNKLGTYENVTEKVKERPIVVYQVYADGKWLSEITGYNDINSNGYAGIFGKEISGIRVKLSNGAAVTVSSHLKGKGTGDWLTPITKWDNTSNGYSGSKGKATDCIAIKASGVTLKYRVHTKGGKWLGWITKYNPADSVNGLAGIYGKPIDAVQIAVV